MAQRKSEYARIEGDTYVTPQWVYDALYEVEHFRHPWDPAPAYSEYDFFKVENDSRDIVTNPPFNIADKFIRHALCLSAGKVAMLLPIAFDSAKTRRDLFEQKPFKAKYTLTKRIRWENLEQKKNGPSTNHAWFVWDWQYEGKPFLGYLPKEAV
jgi:hypothetical protein